MILSRELVFILQNNGFHHDTSYMYVCVNGFHHDTSDMYICMLTVFREWLGSQPHALKQNAGFLLFNFSKLPRVHRKALSNMLPEQRCGLTSAVQGDGAVDREVECSVDETLLQTVQIIRSSAVINQPRKVDVMGVK